MARDSYSWPGADEEPTTTELDEVETERSAPYDDDEATATATWMADDAEAWVEAVAKSPWTEDQQRALRVIRTATLWIVVTVMVAVALAAVFLIGLGCYLVTNATT